LTYFDQPQLREEIMPSPYHAAHLTSLGHEWIAAWNARDLERVLTLYSEDFEMTSEHIHAMGFDPSGTLRGKEHIRVFWAKALEHVPNLRFELIDLVVSPDSVVVFYQNERGRKVGEFLRLDAQGKIAQSSANYGPPPSS
jgi:ketosteroid isomerase-like protein